MKKILLLTTIILWTFHSNAQLYTGAHTFGVSATISIESAFDIHEHNGKYLVAGGYSGALSFGDESIGFNGGVSDGFLAEYGTDGTPSWILQFAASNQDEIVSAVTTDAAGNIYLTGYFKGTNFDADPGTGTSYLSQPSLFLSRDCFIIKLDSDGDFLWAKQISNTVGGGNEDASDIEVDSDGNVYVSGRFNQADFDPGTGTEIVLASGNSDGFLLKLDSSGDYEWVRIFGGTLLDDVNSIALDTTGNIFVTGSFEGNIDLDPSSTTAVTVTSSGDDDTYIVKLDDEGEYVWGKTLHGTEDVVPNDIEVSKEGLVCGGFYKNSVDFDPGIGISSSTSNGEWDAWVLRLDSVGNHVWDHTFGSTGLDNTQDLHISGDDVYVSGTYNGTVAFDGLTTNSTSNGSADFFLVKLNDDTGAYLNHVSFGGTANESSANLTVNSVGGIAMAGAFRNTVDFNPFIGIDNHASVGWNDIFITLFAFEIPDNPVVKLETAPLTVSESGQQVALKATVQYGNDNPTSASMSLNNALSTGTAADVSLGTIMQTSTGGVLVDTLTFLVTITDDMIEEEDETIAITLSSLTNNATFLSDSTFYITILENDEIIDSNVYNIVINEIMYNPPGSNDNSEFIEFYNASNTTVDLEGYTVSGGISHTFAEGVSIAANDYLVVTNNTTKFNEFYGLTAIKWDSGTLSNGGAELKLSNAIGLTTDSIVYDNNNGWPIDAAGNGNTLILCDFMSDNTSVNNWGASQNDLGILINGIAIFASPFAANTCPAPPSIYQISDIIGTDVNGVADSTGVECGLEGIAYGTNVAEFGLLQFTLIDAMNNGVAIDGYLPDFTFTEGDSLRAYGTLYQNNGLLTLSADSIIFINANNDLVEPMVISTLDEDTESSLIKLENLSIVSIGDWPVSSNDQLDLEVTDGTNTYTVSIDKETDIDEQLAPAYTFDLVGIGSQNDASSPYTDSYKIAPRYWADFHLDTVPVLNFKDTVLSVVENAGSLDFKVEMENGNSESTSIQVSLMASGTATESADFLFSTQTLTFEGGISAGAKQITINILDDVIFEGNETFILKISNPTNGNNIAVLGIDTMLTVTIVENEVYGADLVINEILYADNGLQFVEFLNNGDETIDLEDFTITANNTNHTFGTFELSAGQLYVLGASPSVNGTFGLFAEMTTTMDLGTSDILTLTNNSGITVDSVNYADTWTAIELDKKIQSIELCDADTDNNVAANWSASNANQPADWIFNNVSVTASPSEANDCSLVGLNTIPSEAISVYPNPTNGLLEIQSYWNLDQIIITNLMGQEVLRQGFNTQINISKLAKGIYNLKIIDREGAFVIYKIEKL